MYVPFSPFLQQVQIGGRSVANLFACGVVLGGQHAAEPLGSGRLLCLVRLETPKPFGPGLDLVHGGDFRRGDGGLFRRGSLREAIFFVLKPV